MSTVGTGRDDIVSPDSADDDEVVEAALRPKVLEEFVGQERVREQLSLVLEAARQRGRPPDHVLLSGSPGLGKTTLAMIIAAELGAPLRITSGPAIERAGDLAALLSTLAEGEVLFLDEIHRMARPAEEMLYVAMEDFRVDVVVGKGPGATAIPLDVAPFTLVGATTRAGLLPGPLRDRFGFVAHLDFYAPEELERVLVRSAALLDVELRADGAAEIAGRARGTPPPGRRRAGGGRGPPRPGAGGGAPPASPTACSGGSATSPRCAPTASSTARWPGRRCWSTRSTSWGSTGSTPLCSTRCSAAS